MKIRDYISRKHPIALAVAGVMIGTSYTVSGAESLLLEEVIVSAQKRTESMQDVPIAMDAYGEDDIKSRQIADISDLAAVTPSLNFGELAGTAQISVRGVGFGFVTGSGESSVAVHSDGIYISNPGALLFAQSDLAGLEVLRGPQGTLYGRNVTGGVVNFTSPSPLDEMGGRLKVGGGNYGAQSISGNVSVPLSDTVRTRFSIDYLDRDGYIENEAPGGSDYGDVERISGRFAMDIDASDRLTLSVRALVGDEESGGPFYDPIDNSPNTTPQAVFHPFDFDPDPRKGSASARVGTDSELFLGSVRADYDISDNISLVSLTGFVDFENTLYWDADNTTLNAVFMDGRENSDESFSQELNLSGQHSNGTWLIGAFYFKQEKEIIIPFRNATPAFIPIPGTGGATFAGFDVDIDEDFESIAIFADATIDITPELQAFGGVRYLEDERDGSYLRVDILDSVPLPGGGAANGVPVTSCDEDYLLEDEEVTGRLGIKYQWTDNFMSYVQVSTGYKSGGYAIAATCGEAAIYEPESLDSVEVGFKSDLADGRLRLNGSAFFYDYTDLQTEQVVGTAVLVSNGDAEVRGLELSALYLVTERFQLEGGVTFLDSEYTNYFGVDSAGPSIVPGVPGQAVQDLSGNPLPRAPEWAANIGIQYEYDMANGAILFTRLDTLFSASYQTREFDERRDEQGSYHNVNLVTSYTSPEEKWILSLWGKNLTDEEVLLSTVDTGVFAGTGLPGVIGGTWNLPRTFGADIEFRF